MGRKCSVGNCRSNYDKKTVSVYGFPLKDRGELSKWLSVLPNIIDPDKVTRNMGVCALHWPNDTPMKTINGKHRPLDPPSVFSVPKSFLRQTVPSTPRNVNERLSFVNRSAIPDELEEFNKADKIGDFQSLVDGIDQFLSSCSVKFHVLKETNFIHLISFSDENFLHVLYSVRITSNLGVRGYHCNTKVSVKDVLGLQCKLERWSQLDNVINMVKNGELSLPSEIKEVVKMLEKCLDHCDNENLWFLLEQLHLLATSNHGRRYSSKTMNTAISLYLNSKSCYRLLRKVLALPAPITLTRNIGNLTTIGSDSDAEYISDLVFSNVDNRLCMIVFDEIYVKPSLRFRGGHVIGYSADRPQELARTVLSFMVKLIFPTCKIMSSFVVKFVPVFTLKADFLKTQVNNVLKLVEKAGGRCIGLMCDNHASNRSVYTSLRTDPNITFKTLHPMDSSRHLYLLHDPVHLMKCVRNNWLSEKKQTLTLTVPGTGDTTVTGRWGHIKDLYECEKNNTVKRTTLTACAVRPSNIERVKVPPVLQVFHEKTIAALSQDGQTETAGLISYIHRMWKILNNRSTNSHIRLNDEDRRPVNSVNDQNLQYLTQISESVKKMPRGRGIHRVETLTRETADSLTQTLDGLVDLSKSLLQQTGVEFVLLGNLQSDCIEGEFGIYRQAFGGLYFITFEQVLIAAKGRRLQLLQALEVDIEQDKIPSCDNCTHPHITDEEWDVIDNIHDHALAISPEERSSLFYIAGFIRKKEGISTLDTELSDYIADSNSDDSEFLRLVSRGKLTYPETDLFEHCVLCYAFFTASTRRTCRNLLIFIFETIHAAYGEGDYTRAINMRLVNTFFSGLIKRVNDDHACSKAVDQRKRQKLSDQ